MKIVIWGAGGIGCYYGARLQNAGHDVTYVARGAHLQAMQSEGLQVLHNVFTFNDRVNAVSQEVLLSEHHCDEFDLIILCIKNTATESWLADTAEWLKQGSAAILSLQNGVDNEPLIASVVGTERTLGGLAVRIGGHIEQPGVITAKGVAQIVFGAWPNQEKSGQPESLCQQWQEIMRDAEIDATITLDIQRELWRKLLINNGVNPLSALTGLDTRKLTSHPAYGCSVYQMMEETALASQYEGVNLTEQDVDEMFALISQFDAIKTSMLVDKEKGRPLELDGICGAVISRVEKLNKQAPVTSLVDALLRQGVSYPEE